MVTPYKIWLRCEFTPCHYSLFKKRKIVGERVYSEGRNHYLIAKSLDEIREIGDELIKKLGTSGLGDPFVGSRVSILHDQFEDAEYKIYYTNLSSSSIDDLKWMLSAEDFLAYCKSRLFGVEEIVK